MNDTQKAKLFLGGIGKLERLIEEKDSIVSEIRSHRKVMKSEGFAREEVDYALWMRKQTDDGAAEAALAMRMRISQWLGKPLGFQASLDLAEATQ